MKKLLAALVLAAGLSFGAQVSLGIRIGPPPAPRVERVRPPVPGPDYFWVDGYWYPEGNRYQWHEGGAFFEGYWEGDHGRVQHDHRWDRDRNRDFGHERDDRDRH